MDSVYDKVLSCMQKPYSERMQAEILELYPWFLQKAALFAALAPDVVYDIMRNCDFVRRQRDFVIIKQFEVGDCFYILLKGSVAVLIKTDATAEDGPVVVDEKKGEGKEKKPLDRSKFGIQVGVIPSGRSFGELALINADCIRNASIIADEECDLLIVNRELYNRSLKSFQEAELKERKDFIANCVLFSKWSRSHKRQAAMSLRRETFEYGDYLIKQGQPLDGLLFILSGQAKITVDCVMHSHQYEKYNLDFDPDKILDIDSHEPELAVESERSTACSSKTNWESKRSQLGMKPIRRLGYAYGEKLNCIRNLETAIVGDQEVFGIWEYGLELATYAESAVVLKKCEVFILDKHNFERLAFNRRNPGMQALLRELADKWTLTRMRKQLDSRIPLIQKITHNILQQQYMAERKRRKSHILNQREKQLVRESGFMAHLLAEAKKTAKAKESATAGGKVNRMLKIAFAMPTATLSSQPALEVPERKDEDSTLVDDNAPSSLSDAALGKLALIQDWETSAAHLNNLERRIDYWYQGSFLCLLTSSPHREQVVQETQDVAEAVKEGKDALVIGSCRRKQGSQLKAIKLKRFEEEPTQPAHPIIPGKRVYLRPRRGPSACELGASTERNFSRMSGLSSSSARPYAAGKSVFLTAAYKEKTALSIDNKSDRRVSENPVPMATDLGARGQQRQRRRRELRNYTAQEYLELKEELRRREVQMMHFRASLAT